MLTVTCISLSLEWIALVEWVGVGEGRGVNTGVAQLFKKLNIPKYCTPDTQSQESMGELNI